PVGALAGVFPAKDDEGKLIGDIPDKSLGVGAAGAGSLNTVMDLTQAYVNDAGTFQVGGDVTLDSKEATAIVAIAGGATVVKDTNKAAIGLAGAFASDNLGLTTRSFIAGANFSQVHDVTLDASQVGVLFSLSA